MRNLKKFRIAASLCMIILQVFLLVTGTLAEGGWTCPSCGKENTSEMNYCGGCGNARQQESYRTDSGNANAWICSECGHVCPREDRFCNYCGAEHQNKDFQAVLVKKPDPETQEIPPCTIYRINDRYAGEEWKDYSMTAQADGYYHFWIEENSAKLKARFIIVDEQDNRVDRNEIFDSRVSLTVKLQKGATYTVRMKFEGEAGPYTMCVGEPREAVRIREGSIVSDSIEFDRQRNRYILTPSVSGYYRVDLKTIRQGQKVYLTILDDQDYVLNGSDFGLRMGDGIGYDLKAGKTYTISVKACESTGPYTLQIGSPSPDLSVDGCTAVGDSLYYYKQKNRYLFTAPEGGEYGFELVNTEQGNRFSVIVLDDYGYEVGSSAGGNVKVKLEAGKCYTVVVKQSNGFGNYTLRIWEPYRSFF